MSKAAASTRASAHNPRRARALLHTATRFMRWTKPCGCRIVSSLLKLIYLGLTGFFNLIKFTHSVHFAQMGICKSQAALLRAQKMTHWRSSACCCCWSQRGVLQSSAFANTRSAGAPHRSVHSTRLSLLLAHSLLNATANALRNNASLQLDAPSASYRLTPGSLVSGTACCLMCTWRQVHESRTWAMAAAPRPRAAVPATRTSALTTKQVSI